MSKYIKYIPRNRIKRIRLYINTRGKPLRQIVAEESPGLAITGNFYDGNFRSVCPLKAVGVVYNQNTQDNYPVLTWDQGPDMAMKWLAPCGSTGKANHIANCCGIMDGLKMDMYYGRDVRGKRGRTGWGLCGDALALVAFPDGKDGMTPEALRDEVYGLGWTDFILGDGGGKVNYYCKDGNVMIQGNAPSQNLILVDFEEGGVEPPKEEESCMGCAEKLVKTAMGELGTSAPGGDDKYISWYNKVMGMNLSMSVSWCAIFVSWCARHAGVCAGAIPNYHSCTQAMETFKRMNVWKARGNYTPKRGDLIFFDWDNAPSVSEHTGIVTGVENGLVQTVEGNSGTPGAVRVKSYALTSSQIIGYAAWAGEAEAVIPESTSPIKTAQTALNERYKAGLTVDGSWGPASKKAAIGAVQTEINAVYKKNLTVDGSFGPATKAACPTLRQGDMNNLVWVLQLLLVVAGYSLAMDRSFGPSTATAVTAFRKAKGLSNGNTADAAVFAALVK